MSALPTRIEKEAVRTLTPLEIFDITAAREISLSRLLMLYTRENGNGFEISPDARFKFPGLGEFLRTREGGVMASLAEGSDLQYLLPPYCVFSAGVMSRPAFSAPVTPASAFATAALRLSISACLLSGCVPNIKIHLRFELNCPPLFPGIATCDGGASPSSAGKLRATWGCAVAETRLGRREGGLK